MNDVTIKIKLDKAEAVANARALTSEITAQFNVMRAEIAKGYKLNPVSSTGVFAPVREDAKKTTLAVAASLDEQKAYQFRHQSITRDAYQSYLRGRTTDYTQFSRQWIRTTDTILRNDVAAAKEAAVAVARIQREQLSQAKASARAERDAAWNPSRSSGSDRRELVNRGSNAALMGGGAVMLGFAEAGMQAAKFSSEMAEVANNANLSDAQLAKMKTTVVALGVESGASFKDLAEGFRRFINMGFSASDATKMLTASMRSAVSTGASVDATSNALAKAMKEFAIPTAKAAEAMNVLHLAAAQGNGTLQEFADSVGPALSMSANLGVSLVDVSAALVALTRHGYSFAEAATQLHGELAHIVNPSQAAEKELKRLSKTTGIDLVGDFTLAGLKAKGLGGIMDDLKKATKGNEGEILKLIPAFRGGTGAMVQAGNGAEDYKKVILDLNAAMSGKLDPTTKGYARTQEQLDTKVKILNNSLLQLYIVHGPRVVKFLTGAASEAEKLINAFEGLPKPIQDITLGTVAMGAALAVALGTAGKLAVAYTAIRGLAAGAGAAGAAGVGGAAGIGVLGAGGASILGRLGLMSGGFGFGGAMGTSGLAGNLLGGSILAAPFMAGAYGLNKIFGQQNAGYDAQQRGDGVADLSPLVDRISSLRKQEALHPNDKAIQRHLAEATAALRQLSGSNERYRKADGGTQLTDSFAKHIGERTGVQCGQAVSNVLKANGIKESATTLAKSALAHPNTLLHPDAGGHLPPGTIVFFPGRHGGGGVGSNRGEHFAMMGGIQASGGQSILESTTAGKEGRRYRGDRGLAEVAAEHGGQYYAFAPPVSGASPAGGASKSRSRVVADALTDAQTSRNQDVRNQLFEATHGEFENRRHEARLEYKNSLADPDVTDKSAVKKLLLAKLKEINKDEETENANNLKSTQSAHKKVENQWQTHVNRIAELHKSLAATVSGLQSGIARNKGDDALAEKLESVQLAKDRYAQALEGIAQLQTKYGLSDKDSRITQLKSLAGKNQSGAITAAGTRYDKSLQDAKDAAASKVLNAQKEAATAQEEADSAAKASDATLAQLNRELWQHAGGDMKAYFQSLRDEADASLKSVTDRFGAASTHPNAPAVAAATTENSTRKLLIAQQETDALNQLADTRQQHDLEQGKITLADYKAYLVNRRNAFTQYSAEWLNLDSQVYAADTEMQQKQLAAIEEMYRTHVLTLAQYKKSLADLAAAVPITSPVYKDIQGARDGAQARSDRQAIGGRDMWGGMADEASRTGGDLIHNLLNGVKSKDAMKTFGQSFGDMLKSSVSSSFATALKNLLLTGSTGLGGGGGGGLTGLFSGLLGGLLGRKNTAVPVSMNGTGGMAGMGGGLGAGMMGAGVAASMSMIPGLGGMGGLLGGILGGGMMGSGAGGGVQGINGPVGGAQGGPLGGLMGLLPMLGKGGLSGVLGHSGLMGLFAHGGLLTSGGALGGLGALLPWLGGGALLNGILGNPLGGLFKHLKKLFHFAGGGIVPGIGSGDTVPAMLTPGEMVLPKALSSTILQAHAQPQTSRGAAVYGGDTNTVTAHFHGDIRSEMDMAQATKSLARMMERRRRGGVPG